MSDFRSRVINTAGIFATVVGVSAAIGEITRVRPLQSLGSTFAISPVPSPYSTVPHEIDENFRIGVVDEAGQLHWANFDAQFRNQLLGPHRRNVLFLFYFPSLMEAAESNRAERLNRITRYYLCNGGDLARAAGFSEHPSAVVLPLPASNSVGAVTNREPSAEDFMRISCSR